MAESQSNTPSPQSLPPQAPSSDPQGANSAQPSVPPYIQAARKRGRKIALLVYYAVVLCVCVAGAAEVSLQVLWNPVNASPYANCQEGLRALVSALSRARSAAPGNDGEDLAIERFRSALNPEWSYWDSIAQSCQGNAERKRALDAIERLRYAEEHAARWEAGDLAPLRRKVQDLTEKELGPALRTPLSPTSNSSSAEKP